MDADPELTGRVALVTGGSRNIGRAICQRLAAAGAAVALSYNRDEEGAAETVDSITTAGGTAVAYQATLEHPNAPAALAAIVADDLGSVDILVNSAAVRPHQPLGAVSASDFDDVFALNVRAGFLLSQACAAHMVEQGFGRIVFFGGISAYVGHHGRAAVMASKLAVVGVARSLALELAPAGVTVNVVVPGRIDTVRGDEARYGPRPDLEAAAAAIPVGRLGLPGEVAELCAFLAGPHSAYLTGQELFLTGGAYPLVAGGLA